LKQGFLGVNLKSSLQHVMVATLVNLCWISVSWMIIDMFCLSLSQSGLSSSSLITGFVTKITRRIPHVKQELLSLPENLSWPLIFSRVHVTRSLVFCVVFCRSLFVLLSFFFRSLYCLSNCCNKYSILDMT
jgi:hypothetical protein